MAWTDARSSWRSILHAAKERMRLTASHLESKFGTAASPLATTLGRSLPLSGRGADRVFVSAYMPGEQPTALGKSW
jgi:hypothetical protein